MTQCDMIKKNGERCKQYAVAPTRKCRFHGGHAPRGIAHYRWQDKGFSKYLPKNLMDVADSVVTDPDLLNLTHAVAVYFSRITELLGNLQSGDAKQRWTMLQSAINDFRTAQQTMIETPDGPRPDTLGMARAFGEIERIAMDGKRDYLVWDDIDRAIARFQSLVKQEQSRRDALGGNIPAEKVRSFATSLLLSVKRHVRDHDTLMAIQRDMADEINRTPDAAKG